MLRLKHTAFQPEGEVKNMTMDGRATSVTLSYQTNIRRT